MTPYSEILSTLAQVIACCLTAPIHYLNTDLSQSLLISTIIRQIICVILSFIDKYKYRHTDINIRSSTQQFGHVYLLKALCPSDVIWRYRFESILVQVMGWFPVGIKPLTNPMSSSWWRRQMETFYFPRYWPFVRGIFLSPVNSSHKGQWRETLMFYLICAWRNG